MCYELACKTLSIVVMHSTHMAFVLHLYCIIHNTEAIERQTYDFERWVDPNSMM